MQHKGVVLAVLLGTASFLCGCGDSKEKAVKSYETVEACVSDIASEATDEEKEKHSKECHEAWDKAQEEHAKTAPHFTTKETCAEKYGEANCVQRGSSSDFQPVMMGFMAGYLASGMLNSQPLYHDRWGYSYSGASSLGYHRGSYVVAYPRSTWTRSYSNTVTVPRGTSTIVPTTPTRGGFGSSISAAKSGGYVSAPAATTSAPVASSPSSVSRGGFGASAAGAASSGGE